MRSRASRADKIRAQDESVRNANRALAYLEQLFPGSIGEACFIDRSRTRERARREGQGRAAFGPFAGRDGRLLLRSQLRPEARRGLPVRPLRVAGHQRMGDRELDSDPRGRRREPGDRALRDHDREPPRPGRSFERALRRRDRQRAHRRRGDRQPLEAARRQAAPAQAPEWRPPPPGRAARPPGRRPFQDPRQYAGRGRHAGGR